MQQNIDITADRTRQLTDKIVPKANPILVMTNVQLRTVTENFVTAQEKIFLLGHWRNEKIPDPYMHNRLF